MAKKEAKTSKKENNKNKKSFAKDFKAELKRVVWPTPKQLVNNTIAVITIVLITVSIVFALDLTFEALNKYGVEKIKELVISSTDNATVEETTEEKAEDEITEDEASVQNTENVENNTETDIQ